MSTPYAGKYLGYLKFSCRHHDNLVYDPSCKFDANIRIRTTVTFQAQLHDARSNTVFTDTKHRLSKLICLIWRAGSLTALVAVILLVLCVPFETGSMYVIS